MTQAQHANGTDTTNILPPFPAFPSASRYVPIGSVDEAMVRIGRSIDAKEAISLIMGPPGTGKSLICQTLTRRYENSHDVIVLGNAGIEDGDSLLRHVLHCMGADYVAGPTNDLQLSLVDRVSSQQSSHGGLLIIVDEAQSIPKEVFEAIRMMTNIMHNGEPRVSAILCGGPKLDEVLTDPAMEAFTQRVATRCYLHPFSGDETREYITSVIAQCEADPDRTITLEAISAVHHACSGVPRLINQLMTQAIDVAEEMGQSMMDETVIDRAWAMLQQLPSPMIDEPKLKASAGGMDQSVEYGELSDWDSNDAPSQHDDQSPSQQLHESDISVAAPSATWLDDEPECAETNGCDAELDLVEDANTPIEDAVPAASDLFGEFESEEDVAVEQTSIANNSTRPTMAQASQPEPKPEHLPNLESMLHQEIVGMSSLDDSVMIYADHECCEPLSCDGAAKSDPCTTVQDIELHCDGEMEDAVELEIDQSYEDAIAKNQFADRCDNVDVAEEMIAEKLEAEHYNAGALQFVEEADADLDSDPFEMRVVSDDSDMLVIEDELDLVGEQKAPLSEQDREDAAEPVSVDYQQLMLRMRTGS